MRYLEARDAYKAEQEQRYERGGHVFEVSGLHAGIRRSEWGGESLLWPLSAERSQRQWGEKYRKHLHAQFGIEKNPMNSEKLSYCVLFLHKKTN